MIASKRQMNHVIKKEITLIKFNVNIFNQNTTFFQNKSSYRTINHMPLDVSAALFKIACRQYNLGNDKTIHVEGIAELTCKLSLTFVLSFCCLQNGLAIDIYTCKDVKKF